MAVTITKIDKFNYEKVGGCYEKRKGEIIEEGTYDELAQAGGKFSELLNNTQ